MLAGTLVLMKRPPLSCADVLYGQPEGLQQSTLMMSGSWAPIQAGVGTSSSHRS